MANVVGITMQGTDRTAAAARIASANLRGFGATLSQVGNIAATFGGTQMNVLLDSLAVASNVTGVWTSKLTTTKTGLAAIAAAAVAAGAAITAYIFKLQDSKTEAQLKRQNDYETTHNRILIERVKLINDLKGTEAELQLEYLAQVKALQKQETAMGLATGTASEAVKQAAFLRDDKIFQGRKQHILKLMDMQQEANEKYLDGLKTIADFEQGVRDQAFEKQITNLDAQIEAIQRFNQAESDGAQGAAELAAQMQIEVLDGAAQTRAQLDLDYQHRLQQIATLQLTEVEAIRLTTLAAEEAAKRKKQVQTQEAAQMLSATGSLFGNLAALSATFGKKAFGLTQALRYAEAIVNTAAAVTNALATPAPWPVPLIFAAAAAAAGAAQIAVIASAKPPKAHGGLDFVPAEQTFLLSRGERVVQPAQNVALTEFLNEWKGGSGGGDRRPMVVQLLLDGSVLASAIGEMSRDGRLQLDGRAVR